MEFDDSVKSQWFEVPKALQLPTFTHYDGINDTPALPIAVKGDLELMEAGGERSCLGWDQQAITATLNGEVVGVIVYVKEDYMHRLFIRLGYVVPKQRQRGIYTMLWNELIKVAQEKKYRKICGGTSLDNHVMRAVLKRHGRVEKYVVTEFTVPPVA